MWKRKMLLNRRTNQKLVNDYFWYPLLCEYQCRGACEKSNLKLLIYTYMKTKWVLGRCIM